MGGSHFRGSEGIGDFLGTFISEDYGGKEVITKALLVSFTEEYGRSRRGHRDWMRNGWVDGSAEGGYADHSRLV